MEKLTLLERAQYDIISETGTETETVTVLRVRHSGAKVICRVPKHTPEEERQIAANVTRALTQIAYSGQDISHFRKMTIINDLPVQSTAQITIKELSNHEKESKSKAKQTGGTGV